jgi:hypothetical protein
MRTGLPLHDPPSAATARHVPDAKLRLHLLSQCVFQLLSSVQSWHQPCFATDSMPTQTPSTREEMSTVLVGLPP